MNCNTIQDLLPLYVDGCCSEESAKLIEEHIRDCPECRKILEQMQNDSMIKTEVRPKPQKGLPRKINIWAASVLQCILTVSALLLFAIALDPILSGQKAPDPGYYSTLHKMLEDHLIMPAAAILLTLINWFFIKFYRSRLSFLAVCFCMTFLGAAAISLLGAWLFGHFSSMRDDLLFKMFGYRTLYSLIVSTVFSFFSWSYAALLGKE